MSQLPPSYSDATTPTYPPGTGGPSAPAAPYTEKSPYPEQQPPQGPYPPTQQSPYPPQGYAPQGQPQGYPPQGQPQGYPPQGQPQGYPPQGQPQGYPPQGQPQGYPPQGYAPQKPQGYPQQQYPQQPYTQPPQPAPPATNVTVVTQHQNVGANRWYGGSSSFTGILIYSVIAIFCCFPLGIAAFIVAIWAYSEFSNGNFPKAIGLSRLASGLATTAFVIGIITIILSFSLRYTLL